MMIAAARKITIDAAAWLILGQVLVPVLQIFDAPLLLGPVLLGLGEHLLHLLRHLGGFRALVLLKFLLHLDLCQHGLEPHQLVSVGLVVVDLLQQPRVECLQLLDK